MCIHDQSALKSTLKIHVQSRSKHSKVNCDGPCVSNVETQCSDQHNSIDLKIEFIQTSEVKCLKFLFCGDNQATIFQL